MGYLLQHLLTESAQRRPEATAVRLRDAGLSYGALEAQSNQCANALIDAGLQPGEPVCLHLPKTLEAIIAVFGILKAGGCYVPVEATSPPPRLFDIVQQCGTRFLITNGAAREKLATASTDELTLRHAWIVEDRPDLPVPATVRATSWSAALAGQSDTAPGRSGTDQDLAYVLFTSGSTGKPKGVMLSHLNALTFVDWGHHTFQVTKEDRLSNHAPLNFDLSVFDLFVALKASASVSLVPDRLALLPARLADWIQEEGITIWYSVPSVLTLLLTYGKLDEHDLSALRTILFAGEVFPTKHLRHLMQAIPQARYYNLYGPTETNVCTYYEVPAIPEERSAPIPIGRACANTEVIAIDDDGQRVTGPGREGLLYARGSTVMQGYFGRPADTERTFITNPYSPGRQERLYCTGDWVTLDADGNYRYVGRRDHMVKARGYRVELGEIEAALYAHPAIREAVAIAIPDDLLGHRLKVFVVPEDGAQLGELDVKQHCARLLPFYMVPDLTEVRAALPHTVTDKIDRARLSRESATAAMSPG